MSSEAITRNDLTAILNEVLPSPSWTDFFYPVGSYYETSDTSFDPNVSWGGTWSLETAGQVHISAGTGYTVNGALTNTTDGGASTVTLDSTQIPSHTHQAHADTSYKFLTSNASMYVQNDKRLAPTNSSGTYYMMTASAAHNVSLPTTTQATGGGGAHNNMPPYIIVNRWHRTA